MATMGLVTNAKFYRQAQHISDCLTSDFVDNDIIFDVALFDKELTIRVKYKDIRGEYVCDIAIFDYEKLKHWIHSVLFDEPFIPFDTIEWEDDIWEKDTQ